MNTSQNLAVLPSLQASRYGERAAFRHRNEQTGEWVATSWNQFATSVRHTAEALAEYGLSVQENVAIYTQNKPEGLIVDFALFANRAVPVPLYATSTVQQISYIINEAEIALIFVGEQYQYDNAYQAMAICPTLKQIVVFDSSVKLHVHDTTTIFFQDFVSHGAFTHHKDLVKQRTSELHSDDLACIIYTSGTTGVPKGVMLKHESFMEAMHIHSVRLDVSDEDRSMCFLPLAHIFERAWSYFCLFKGIQIEINLRPAEIQKTIQEVQPTILCSVPRFWEKVYAGVQEKIASSKGIQKTMILAAIHMGRIRNMKYVRVNKKAPFWIELQYKFYDKMVISKLRRAIGIPHGNIFPTAGAPLSDTINEFLHACGINILYGYGLSETTATVTCFDKTGYELGTVGFPMQGVQIRIGENNEIQVKGKTVTMGYYKKPEETAAVFTEDGWFKTGDAGEITPEGALKMTDRIKDLFKTSNGKYIAPQSIEMALSTDKFIDQVAAIGDQRKYVSALIVPDFVALKEYAKQHNIQYSSIEDLLQNSKVLALFTTQINELQKEFAQYEQIKRFTLLPKAFSMEEGELTNTLKIKRKVVAERYAEQIEAMYKD